MSPFNRNHPHWVGCLALLSAAACLPIQQTHAPAVGPYPDAPSRATATVEPLDPARDQVLEPERLACAVLTSNPELAAWRETSRAAQARVDKPTAVGNTSVSYTFAPASIGSDRVRYGQVVQIEQSFRLGQTQLERQVARAEASATQHDRDATERHLVLLATTLFDAYYATSRALETNAEHADLIATLLDTATVRYATGDAPQQDPIQAELEVAHIEHERVVLESQRDVVKAQINGLLHRAPDAALPPPPKRIASDRPQTIAGADAGETGDAYGPRPESRAALALEEAAQQRTTLARRRFSPSISVMGTYNSMWQELPHQFMVGAGLSIPLQVRSLRSGISEAQAQHRAARHQREAVEDAIEVERATARLELKEAHHVANLHESRLLPAARARVDAATVGYETGDNDFSAVIEAERELRQLELDLHQALARLADKRAELQFALGKPPNCRQGGGGR